MQIGTIFWCGFLMYEGFLTTSDLMLDMDGVISWKYILVKGLIGGFGTGGDGCAICKE